MSRGRTARCKMLISECHAASCISSRRQFIFKKKFAFTLAGEATEEGDFLLPLCKTFLSRLRLPSGRGCSHVPSRLSDVPPDLKSFFRQLPHQSQKKNP